MQNKNYVLLLCFLCMPSVLRAQVQKAPNIVMIIADDHGKEAIGAYGNPVIKTPAIDQLANEGIRFNNAFCTSASCSASRSVILTGKFGHSTGHYGHAHAYHHFSTFDGEKSLPIYLKEAGYQTARIGKYHLAPEAVYKFETVLGGNCRNPVSMAETCEAFIEKTEKPFFLYFCTCDPHRGGGVIESHPYKPDVFGNKKEGYKGVETLSYTTEEVIVPPFLPDTEATRQELAQYYESVSRVDQGVARLISILKKNGKYENTIILYLSDNGVAFPGAKTMLYEAGMELPLIVKMPNQHDKGTQRDQLVSWVDLSPTLYELATGNALEDVQGLSFKKVLEDKNAKGAAQIYAAHNFHEVTMYYPMRVIRNQDYKLIYNIAYPLTYPFASDLWASATWQYVAQNEMENYGQRSIESFLHHPQFELYDLKNDPNETVNLINSPHHQEMLKSMVSQLRNFQERTNDPWLSKWKYE
ncbi:sulfatase family protein [Sediminitomix flava]|uniref:N-sulfoglucosamine sulfohydrolase n=1 Tax=Sediminitomix flava TaxID=379075 RepID=A0A315Z503_SEDFL|nr:sulfatase [Sediminitomix flava]PWJ37895.1 N-sulfoglucosamine sulfohydrolase [Sediminitomix flava]